ncbi:Uncharacterised protein [Sphingobacterium spiritivorum]|uniref:Uncharacterized protein n=1 Tax=Sphingobacterium spiritivorum TaxID=258 RepID=A0A380CP33_SPHSI|nr:hypothetical protein [Sphingobacterium spiritivorum]SUJ25591.1 Uncharacterised protein [Sphingobacterium spiritivorum]
MSGGLWGWLKGVFSSKEDVAARIVLEEAVVTRVVKAKPAYETFGVRVDHIQQPTLSATKPDPYRTSYSHRQMMYNYSQMLANTNYNDLSNPTTSLAIGQNIANFGFAEIATIKVIGRVGSLYNAFGKGILKPLGLGSTGRTTAANLMEQMVMKDAMANPQLGTPIIEGLKDSRWLGWTKMQYSVTSQNGQKAVVHYVAKWENGVIKAVDDFKFK